MSKAIPDLTPDHCFHPLKESQPVPAALDFFFIIFEKATLISTELTNKQRG
jgi:hypothetical protein